MLHRVAILDSQRSPNSHPGCALSSLENTEVALIVVETGHIFPEQVRNLPTDIRIYSVLTSIHKDPFLLGMRMKINKHKAFAELESLFSCVEYLRMVISISPIPHSIQVIPR